MQLRCVRRNIPSPPPWKPYIDSVVGLAWSDDPESCTGGSTATGRVFNAGQVKGDDPNKKLYPCPPCRGLGVGLTTPPLKSMFVVKLLRRDPLRTVMSEGEKKRR